MNKKKERITDILIALLYFIIPLALNWDVITHDELTVTADGMITFTNKLFQFKAISNGELPLWNSFVGTGVPFFSDPQTFFFYPIHALALFLSPALYTNLYYVFHIGLAGLFTYLFLKQTSRNRWIAFAGGLVFSISVVLGGLRREHVMVYTSIAWLPVILFFIQRFITNGKKGNLILSAFAMSMQVFGGHIQWAFYTDILVFIYLLYNLLSLRYSLSAIIKIGLGWIVLYLLFSSILLIPTAELIIQSSRGIADSNYFCFLSPNWKLILMTVFPYIFADISSPYGVEAATGVYIELYLGILPLIYALYAIRYQFKNRLIKFSSIVIVISLIYASCCQIPFLGIFLQKIPILNYFGVQSRDLFIYIFFGIVCFAYGIVDMQNPEYMNRLVKHSFIMVFMFVFIVIILSAVGWSPFPVKDSIFSFIQIQNPYTISILIAVINFILVGFLYLIRKKQKLFTYSSWAVMISLLLITMVDVERFSSIHSVANFKQLTETEETTALKKLIGDNPYRILPIYNQIYGGNYYDSGLVDNWSMTNNIRNLKGFAEFENPRLNELFGQVESRDPNEQNTQNLLSEKKDILSMLSVKYVLLPINEETPKATPFLPEADVINITEPITDPGNGSLFVDSIPIDYSPEQYYSIKFDVDISKNVPQLFYVDFYGGPEFDRNEQQKNVIIETGSHTYKVLIYSGDKNFQYGEVYLRIVSITNNPMKINNIKVTRLASETDNQNYGLIGQTSRYKILENKQAQKLLYIPEQVKNIIDDNDILKNPTNYPQMDKIDYIKGSNDFTTGGKLEIIDIKNNSLSARVISTNKTFVNHAQSYFPGWKAYIDGKSTPIYLVNGVIQGIEVPPGEHTIRFVYDPLSLKIGALLTFAGILFGLVFIILERKHKVNK